MGKSYFQVFEGADKRFYFRLIGGNGEIVAQSEAYATKSNATRAANHLPEVAKEAVDSGVVVEDVKRKPS